MTNEVFRICFSPAKIVGRAMRTKTYKHFVESNSTEVRKTHLPASPHQ
jgi:hypothetical protein